MSNSLDQNYFAIQTCTLREMYKHISAKWHTCRHLCDSWEPSNHVLKYPPVCRTASYDLLTTSPAQDHTGLDSPIQPMFCTRTHKHTSIYWPLTGLPLSSASSCFEKGSLEISDTNPLQADAFPATQPKMSKHSTGLLSMALLWCLSDASSPLHPINLSDASTTLLSQKINQSF